MNADRQKCYSYIRFSSDAQAFGQSLKRQTEKTREFAKKHNLELVEDYQDLGVSAFRGSNITAGALGRFIAAVRDSKIPKDSFLCIESLDRISRQAINQSLPTLFEILNNGIHIATLIDNRIYKAGETGLDDVLNIVITLSRAYDESFTKSGRSKYSWAKKRKAGIPLTAQCPAWLERSEDGSHFVEIPKRAAVVRSIFAEAAAGIGVLKISKRLNQKSEPVWGRSKTWQPSYIAIILNNRAVIGEHQHCTVVGRKSTPIGEPIADYYPPVIDPDLFYRVQQSKADRQHHGRGRKGAYFTNLFSGVATCAYCAALKLRSTMYYQDKGKGHTFLVCGAAKRGAGCGITRGWPYEHFEASFLAFVEKLDLPALVNDTSAAAKELDDKIQSLEGQLRALQEVIEKAFALLDIKPNLEIAADQLEAKQNEKHRVQQQLNDAKAQRQTLVSSEQAFHQSKAEIIELIDRLQSQQGADAKDLYKLRARVSARIRSLCKEIQLYTVGDTPFGTLLEDGSIVRNEDDERYFHVVFADGSTLRMYPHREEPLEYDWRTELDPDGKRVDDYSIDLSELIRKWRNEK